jgi:hypothetical protein
MKVELRLPQQDVEANVRCYNANGGEVKVARIVIEPIFHQASSKVPLLYATTMIEGEKAPQGETPVDEEVQRFMLTLSGVNGKTTLIDRSKKVRPQFESKMKLAHKDDVDKTPEKEPEQSPEPNQPIGVSSGMPGEIDLPDSTKEKKKQ